MEPEDEIPPLNSSNEENVNPDVDEASKLVAVAAPRSDPECQTEEDWKDQISDHGRDDRDDGVVAKLTKPSRRGSKEESFDQLESKLDELYSTGAPRNMVPLRERNTISSSQGPHRHPSKLVTPFDGAESAGGRKGRSANLKFEKAGHKRSDSTGKIPELRLDTIGQSQPLPKGKTFGLPNRDRGSTSSATGTATSSAEPRRSSRVRTRSESREREPLPMSTIQGSDKRDPKTSTQKMEPPTKAQRRSEVAIRRNEPSSASEALKNRGRGQKRSPSPAGTGNATTRHCKQSKESPIAMDKTPATPPRSRSMAATDGSGANGTPGGTPSALKAKLSSAESPFSSIMRSISRGEDSGKVDIQLYASAMFRVGTGLADEEIHKVLNLKSNTKQWELKKKVEHAHNVLKQVKDTLHLLHRAKNKLVVHAVAKEKSLSEALANANNGIDNLRAENEAFRSRTLELETEIVTQKDISKGKDREIELTTSNLQRLEAEVTSLKDSLAAAEKAHNDACIALAVAQARTEEATKQAEGWRSEIAAIESSRVEASKKAEESYTAALEEQLSNLRDECATLRAKMEAKEQEMGRLVDGVVATEGGSQFDRVKETIDAYRRQISELESEKAIRQLELEKATDANKVAKEAEEETKRHVSDLTRSITEIRKAGELREDNANEGRKKAEARAADLEALLAEAQREISVLNHEKNTLKETIESQKEELVRVESTVKKLRAELSEQVSLGSIHLSKFEIERELRARAEQKEEEERRERIALSAQMVAMTQEHTKVEATLREANEGLERQWQEKLTMQKALYDEKQKEIDQMNEKITGLDGERESLKQALNDKKSMADAKNLEELGRLTGEISILKERLRSEETRSSQAGIANAAMVRTLEEQIREGQAERRRMHNIIQELRGNVRVFARIRPFLPNDAVGEGTEPSVLAKSDTALKIQMKEGSSVEHSFTFDKVFPPSVGQEAVFTEVSEFVQSALDGYNVCLFSYGQTGSGKTHTMQGSGVGQMRGIIPRAIEQVGTYKETLEKDGWRYEMKVSFLEIYNESIRDLLRENREEGLRHDIKLNSDGRRYVSDLTMRVIEPTDLDSVEEIMRQAAKHRSVASTEMNEVSSRSHSVFTLHLTAVHQEQRQTLRGALNLVDLAGSERLYRSGATGDRAKEAVAINKSLTSLTDVFVAIGKKAHHVPFRNSKLTYLLQPCLSGDGKTLMLVNLSPTDLSTPESLCSLRFASQVNKCELGKPKRAIEDVTDN